MSNKSKGGRHHGAQAENSGEDGKGLLIALSIGLINCLPQIIGYAHAAAIRMMDEGYSLDIRLGAFSLRFGGND